MTESKKTETRQWKDSDRRKRVPSGKKLTWSADGDCVLRFLGYRDVVNPETGEIYKYLAFTDGLQVVSCNQSYALAQVEMTPDNYYYIHNNGEIDTKLGSMNDLEIIELGAAGETIEGIPDMYANRLCPGGGNSFTCENGLMKELNFKYLNYCHRTVEKPTTK